MTEFELIQRFFQKSEHNGDDAARIDTPEGHSLVTSIDTSVAGRHFTDTTDPVDIGYKSLAVSMSDMAAMGATPIACLLSLSLPTADPDWLTAFSRGFFELADHYAVALIGGDTTQGPLVISTVLFGTAMPQQLLKRSGARAGDHIYVSGSLGNAAAALKNKALDQTCLNRPEPRIALGIALRPFATSCIDISDGLAQDLSHILTASRLGATVYANDIPQQAGLKYALTGGDDYELCFTAAATHAPDIHTLSLHLNLPLTCIGQIEAAPGLRVLDDHHAELNLNLSGYQHFK